MKLENDNISIECLTDHGGKLSSIFDKEKQFEFLFQNPKTNYSKAEVYSDFSLFEACGFDDTFPSIDAQEVIFDNKKIAYPDHGEIWSANMKAINLRDKIKLEYDSVILPYHYQKTISLKENGLKIDYFIKNTGDFDFPGFYTFHCLVDSKPAIELITPKDCNEVKIVFPSSRFEQDECVNYPIAKNSIDLSKPTLLNKNECEKFYFTKPLKEGVIGYDYKNERVKLLISFDSKKLPYLGFWNTQGGFRSDYNFALEMSNGYYDSIDIARKNNACPILKTGEEFSFSIEFDIEKY